eukprot:NODE_260_length_11481_cov_1.187928.p10 type:complete len:112 gc:universal NODE_260_length_11481_cov_1.187928:614-279(-)
MMLYFTLLMALLIIETDKHTYTLIETESDKDLFDMKWKKVFKDWVVYLTVPTKFITLDVLLTEIISSKELNISGPYCESKTILLYLVDDKDKRQQIKSNINHCYTNPSSTI